MNVTTSIFLTLSGVAVGIGFALSCGDNLIAKATADAADDAPKTPDTTLACDCPTAEPPLTNRLVMLSVIDALNGNSEGEIFMPCPPGARPISGSCTVDGPPADRDVILRQSGLSKSVFSNELVWRCSYRNNESTRIYYNVAVWCLKPA